MTITKRADKGAELTWVEMDDNFRELEACVAAIATLTVSLDGGSAATTFLDTQSVDGGNANG